MSELWSPQQHGWLVALGHTVYLQGALPEEEAEVVASATMRAGNAPVAVVRAPRRAPEAPRETSRRPAPDPPRRAVSGVPDKLHFALIRASGCNPNAAGAEEIMARWPATAELRGNPAAKRLLWPQLRALRKSASS